MRESNTYFPAGSYPVIADVGTIVGLREQASRQRTIAGISAAAGAVLVGTGVYLWLNDRPQASAAGLSAVSVGPGGVSLRGSLP